MREARDFHRRPTDCAAKVQPFRWAVGLDRGCRASRGRAGQQILGRHHHAYHGGEGAPDGHVTAIADDECAVASHDSRHVKRHVDKPVLQPKPSIVRRPKARNRNVFAERLPSVFLRRARPGGQNIGRRRAESHQQPLDHDLSNAPAKRPAILIRARAIGVLDPKHGNGQHGAQERQHCQPVATCDWRIWGEEQAVHRVAARVPAHDGRGQVTQGPAAPIEQADSVLEGSRAEAEEE